MYVTLNLALFFEASQVSNHNYHILEGIMCLFYVLNHPTVHNSVAHKLRGTLENTCTAVISRTYFYCSTDCALKLEKGEVDLGIFTAEEAILVSKFDTHEQRVVIGEIRLHGRDEGKNLHV
jgi:hypothetical protein